MVTIKILNTPYYNRVQHIEQLRHNEGVFMPINYFYLKPHSIIEPLFRIEHHITNLQCNWHYFAIFFLLQLYPHIKYKQSVVEFDYSFTRSERMFIFIFIRFKIAFWRKIGFSVIDFCNTNIWITKSLNLASNSKTLDINPMYSHQNSSL